MIYISTNNFKEMRAEYKDYLRSKNFNDDSIHYYLNILDTIWLSKNYLKLYQIMKDIGVIII